MNTSETGSGILDFEAGFRSDHVSLVTISKASHGESKKNKWTRLRGFSNTTLVAYT